MSLLVDAKTALRIASTTTAYDIEINDLISAAQSDMKAAGVEESKATDATTTDPLVKRAILLFVKAHFGFDNPDADRLNEAYRLTLTRLATSPKHTEYTVTFDCSAQCKIRFNGVDKWTDTAGNATFFSRAQNHVPYQINYGAEQYVDVSDDVTVTVTV